MGERTDIAGLIERLEAATGPSEELGVRVLSAFLSREPIVAVERSPFNGAWCAYYEGFDGKRRLWEAPVPFRQMQNATVSLDAALALVERVRPGAGWAVGKTPGGTGWARVFKAREHYSEAPTPAIALLIALLKSLETEQ